MNRTFKDSWVDDFNLALRTWSGASGEMRGFRLGNELGRTLFLESFSLSLSFLMSTWSSSERSVNLVNESVTVTALDAILALQNF